MRSGANVPTSSPGRWLVRRRCGLQNMATAGRQAPSRHRSGAVSYASPGRPAQARSPGCAVGNALGTPPRHKSRSSLVGVPFSTTPAAHRQAASAPAVFNAVTGRHRITASGERTRVRAIPVRTPNMWGDTIPPLRLSSGRSHFASGGNASGLRLCDIAHVGCTYEYRLARLRVRPSFFIRQALCPPSSNAFPSRSPCGRHTPATTANSGLCFTHR